MIKLCASAAVLVVTLSTGAIAQTTLPATMTTLRTCDHQAPVCGVMSRNRLVPFSDECEARSAGATKVLFGACYDED